MNTIKSTAFKLLTLFAFSAFFASCAPELDGLVVELDKDIPYQEIFVTVQGEKVQGFPDSTGAHINSIYLKYLQASKFELAKVEIKETPGYSCVYPENLDSVKLAAEGVLIFRTPRGQKVKYYFNVDSSSKMIVDGSKVKVEGADDVVVTCNDLAGTITVPYDPTKMKNSSIHLLFKDGALDDDVTINSSTYLDFTSSLTTKLKMTKLSEEYKGQREFTVTLSVASLLTDYSRYGFADRSLNYVSGEDAEHIKIYQAEALSNVPIRNYNYVDDVYYPETPFDWELDASVDSVEIFGMPGDWTSDRKVENFPNETTPNIAVTVVLIDPEYVTGRIVVDDSRTSYAGQLDGLITMSGMSTQDETYFWSDGVTYCPSASDVQKTMENDYIFRNAIAFTQSGQFQISLAVWNYSSDPSKCCWYKWTEGYMDVATLDKAKSITGAQLKAKGVLWADVKSVATCTPCHCMTGRLLTNLQVLAADCSHGTAAFGSAWNGTRRRAFMGITYDNKIALATFYSTKSQHCIGSCQASWLLNKLGWRDIVQTGTEFYKDDGYNPVIKVNGSLVSGAATSPSYYSIVFDKK